MLGYNFEVVYDRKSKKAEERGGNNRDKHFDKEPGANNLTCLNLWHGSTLLS
jgi:hypothetical protein